MVNQNSWSCISIPAIAVLCLRISHAIDQLDASVGPRNMAFESTTLKCKEFLEERSVFSESLWYRLGLPQTAKSCRVIKAVYTVAGMFDEKFFNFLAVWE